MRPSILAVTAVLALSGPALAFDVMSQADCQLSVEKLADLFGADEAEAMRAIDGVIATNEGWCQVKGGAPGYEGVDFDVLEWRADGTSRWTVDGVPPWALELRATGLDPDDEPGVIDTGRPDLDLHMILRQEPDAGQVIIERFAMDNGVGDALLLSAVFERVFLSSPSMMQVSAGSAAFKAGLFSMTLTGEHENPFGFNVEAELRGNPQAQIEAAFKTISRLPEGVVDSASRAELTAFAGDLPSPVGRLEMTAHSERGLGLMQIGMSLYQSFASIIEDDDGGVNLDLMLDGLTVSADWTPASQVAD